MSRITRPIAVLVSALGGQGGGVLTDWLNAAALARGVAAQSTFIAGVAQRTGATTYYFEVYPDLTPQDHPVFSIHPAPGAVDLLVAFEPTEAARALSVGLIGPETTVIAAAGRVYSTAEKIMGGDGRVDVVSALQAVAARAGRLVLVDMSGAARKAGAHPNSVMFGAMAASGVLPFDTDECRAAVEAGGKAVKANLAGFDAGVSLSPLELDALAEEAPEYRDAPARFLGDLASLPEVLRPVAGHALAHLCDYQDAAYARLYLERLQRIIALDDAQQGYALSLAVARRLAAWMGFDDVIRVAQVKTAPGRMQRIRRELGVPDDLPLVVHDYLKPGRAEFADLLPWGEGGDEAPRRLGGGLKLRIRTSGLPGWLMMRALAGLRPLRPRMRRYRHEQALIEGWLGAICRAAPQDLATALDIARLAVWARGYGETRARGLRNISGLLAANTIDPEYKKRLKTALDAARADPDMEVI